LTSSRLAAFFGVGMLHGDVSPASSAKRDEDVVGAGAVSSPNNDFELAWEFVSAASGGEVPNKDIVQFECYSLSPKRRFHAEVLENWRSFADNSSSEAAEHVNKHHNLLWAS
jgi:hypothetical protein